VFPRWRTALFVNGCVWHSHRNLRLSEGAEDQCRLSFLRPGSLPPSVRFATDISALLTCEPNYNASML
jgi:hypothetical protein